VYRLKNPRRGYAWGSATAIPHFAGEPADGTPVAEEWMGTHPLGESLAVERDGVLVPLSSVAGPLPFMFKLLAADTSLSVQVHPSLEIARAGFEAEQASGLHLEDPARTFKDANHKPEMAYALTTFDSLVGFRPTAEILRILHGLDVPLARRLADGLAADPGFAGIVRLVEDVLSGGVEAGEVEQIVAACDDLLGRGIDVKRAYATVVEVAEDHPGDPGLVIALLLNRLTLQPGEAAFLGDGIIHAHLRGMCLEVMANSDNVLRAGLTAKPLDVAGLVECLDVGMSRLARVTPLLFGASTDIFAPDVEEFALAVGQCSTGEPAGIELPASSHRIIVCTGGDVEIVSETGQRVDLARGQSLYAGPQDGTVRAVGLGEVAQAYLPPADGLVAAGTRLVDLV
jgi:mannose-6-phosphate isomerase